MWIKNLVSENFSGMNFADEYSANEVKISGRNRSGKTTRIKAWFWLLTGYTDANSAPNSNLFDNRVELTKDTPVARVWAKVVLDNSSEYKIERVAKAKFTRKRGTDIYEKAPSDEYTYFIDNIERNATEFKAWLIENIAPDDMLKFCLDGSFFIKEVLSDKKKARQIIERVVGKVTREEMSGDYSAIEELLQRYSLDEIDNRAQNMAKSINARLTEIPALIQNAETQISELRRIDFDAIEKDIIVLEGLRESCDRQILDLAERMRPQMEARAEAIRQKEMREAVLTEAYNKWKNEPQAEIDRLTSEINAIRRQNDESKRKHDDAVSQKERYTTIRDNAIINLKAAELKREKLLAERDAAKARQIDPSAKKCPNCGTELTGDKLQEVLDMFESFKRDRINQIVELGRRNNDDIKRYTKEAEDAQPYIDAAIPEVINQSYAELEQKVAALVGTSRTMTDFLQTEHGKQLQSDIDAVVVPEVNMPDNAEIKERKDTANADLVPLYEQRGMKSRIDSLTTSINELRAEQKEKGTELAMYERQRQAVKNFRQEQMEVLSRKVNSNLRFSQIEVWSTQKDGTVIPDLVIKDAQGVNYTTTNGASRIVTAIDIQRFFCDKLNVNMPCFVDESSIINADNMPVIEDVQMFYLYCSDSPLHIETK